MSEIKNNEHNEQNIENTKKPENPSENKETEAKKQSFENSLDSASSTGKIEPKESKEAKTDDPKVSEVKTEGKNPEDKKQEFGGNLDDLSSGGEAKETDEKEKERLEKIEGVKEINAHYYSEARELAKESEKGSNFTDHTEAHVEQVAEKSLETADSLENAIEKGKFKKNREDDPDFIEFKGDIDKSVLEGAALAHDTGMRGDGYSVQFTKDSDGKKVFARDENGKIIVSPENNDDFDEVRNNHSLNSGLNVLADREKYKELGYTDEQVDMMAMECMAHSKSGSTVHDVNSKNDWENAFDCMDAFVDAYNADHPENQIQKIDRASFENNDDKMGKLATSTLALRAGDASRNSGPDAITQSGEEAHVGRETINDNGGSTVAELKDAEITRGDLHKPIEDDIPRKVHAGEQNIVDNHTICDDEGNIVHKITVNDGESAPACTAEAILDHAKEFASASGGEFNIEIEFNEPCTTEKKQKIYEDIRSRVNSDNVNIIFAWEKE